MRMRMRMSDWAFPVVLILALIFHGSASLALTMDIHEIGVNSSRLPGLLPLLLLNSILRSSYSTNTSTTSPGVVV
jgi:hypothetical protein